MIDEFELDADRALNDAIFKRILDDDEFRGALKDLYATRVYRRARAPK